MSSVHLAICLVSIDEQLTRLRSFCVSFAVLVSQLLEKAEMDIALTRRLSLISELFALDGK